MSSRRRAPLSLLVAGVAALALTVAGCSAGSAPPAAPGTSAFPAGPAPSAPASTQTPEATPTPPVEPLTADAMLTAPVPSLCGHEPGVLVDGRMDAAEANMGGVWLSGYPDDGWPANAFHSWLDEDGRPRAVAVVECSQGGVGWPPNVVFYGEGPSVLGAVSVDEVVGAGRQSVSDLEPITDGVRLTLPNTYDEGEGGCCGSLTVVADFVWDGSTVAGTVVERLSPNTIAREAMEATLAQDETAIARLFTPDGQPSALAFGQANREVEPEQFLDDPSCKVGQHPEFNLEHEYACTFFVAGSAHELVVALTQQGGEGWRAVGIQWSQNL